MIKFVVLIVVGLSAGTLVSGGVFTTLIALGIVPRFAGRTHTANRVMTYENSIIGGCLLAIFLGLCPFAGILFSYITELFPALTQILFSVSGFFAGCFVGCMALAIAEMLDGIPIFARRVGFRQGLGVAVISIAIGKMLGSLYYFLKGIALD